MLETAVGDDLVVRMKVSSTLRVERSSRFETALRGIGCGLKVERMAVSSGV
jgi:hypothetical protein